MIHWLLGLWHAMYVPRTGPFYNGATWGNVFVVAVLAPLGWVWSRTRFWPLQPTHDLLAGLHVRLTEHLAETRRLHAKVDRLHARHDAHAEQLKTLAGRLEDLHAKVPERRKRAGS